MCGPRINYTREKDENMCARGKKINKKNKNADIALNWLLLWEWPKFINWKNRALWRTYIVQILNIRAFIGGKGEKLGVG